MESDIGRREGTLTAEPVPESVPEHLGEHSPERTGASGRRRVAPLPPEDRRAAIIEATLPLLQEHGAAVSTRAIAEAAGVAEGTIFRVFPDKNALLIAAVIQGVELPTQRPPMWGIDPLLDLRARLTAAVEMLTTGLRRLGRLPEVMRSLMADEVTRDAIAPVMERNRQEAQATFAEVLAPDAARLRISLAHAARIALFMTFSSSGFLGGTDALAPAEIVAVLLDGLLKSAPADAVTDGEAHRAP